jgi:hypothetical protein
MKAVIFVVLAAVLCSSVQGKDYAPASLKLLCSRCGECCAVPMGKFRFVKIV